MTPALGGEVIHRGYRLNPGVEHGYAIAGSWGREHASIELQLARMLPNYAGGVYQAGWELPVAYFHGSAFRGVGPERALGELAEITYPAPQTAAEFYAQHLGRPWTSDDEN